MANYYKLIDAHRAMVTTLTQSIDISFHFRSFSISFILCAHFFKYLYIRLWMMGRTKSMCVNLEKHWTIQQLNVLNDSRGFDILI